MLVFYFGFYGFIFTVEVAHVSYAYIFYRTRLHVFCCEIKSHPNICRAKFLIQRHAVGGTRERFLSPRHYTVLVTQSLFYTKCFANWFCIPAAVLFPLVKKELTEVISKSDRTAVPVFNSMWPHQCSWIREVMLWRSHIVLRWLGKLSLNKIFGNTWLELSAYSN